MTNPAALVVRNAMLVDSEEIRTAAKLLLAHGHESGLFPANMTPVQAGAIARLALAYGLDPFAEHLVLYQGRPYLTKKGAVHLATEHSAFDGMSCAPATADERNAFRCQEEDHLWKATVRRKDRALLFTGWGLVSPQETLIGRGGELVPHPIARKHPQAMAQTRAIRRALMDAFSMPAPVVWRQEDEEEAPIEAELVNPPQDLPATPPVANRPNADELSDADWKRIEHYRRMAEEPEEPDEREWENISEIAVTRALPRPENSTQEYYQKATAGQLAAIHIALSNAGWDDPTYRQHLQEIYGVKTSKDLTPAQASSLIETLKAGIHATAASSSPQPAGTQTELAAGFTRWLRRAAALNLDLARWELPAGSSDDDILKLAPSLRRAIETAEALARTQET